MDDSQRKLAAEFVGTFALIFFGAGAALQGADLVGQALANGLAIGLMVTAVGHISGGHFNPAVTLSMLVTRPHRDRPRRCATGSASSPARRPRRSCCSRSSRHGLPSAITDAANLGVPAVGGHGISTGNALVAEIVATFFLVFVIYGVAVDKRGAFSILAGLPIGLTISIGVLAVGAVSGAALNPARWFGPALVSGSFDDFWVWILGPAIGAVARRARLRPAPAQGHAGGVADDRPLIPCGGTAVPFHHTAQRQGRWHERREQRARAARDGPSGRLARRDRDRARRRRERPPDLPRPRRRAARAREHVRGHGVPALERAPARRRGARRPPAPRRRGHGRALRGARRDPLARAPTRWRWTSCARASRSGAPCAAAPRAATARTRSGRSRRRRRSSPTSRACARAPSCSRRIPSSGSSRTTCSR